MASPMNINPNMIPQSGIGEESIAGSSSMIVTGLEKELHIKKTKQVTHDPKIDLKQIDQYIQKLTETTVVESVKKWDERDKKNDKNEETLPRSKKRKQGKNKPAPAFSWMGKKSIPKRKAVFNVGKIDRFKGKLDPESLKKFVQAHIKNSLGLPVKELSEASENVAQLKRTFASLNIHDEVIVRTQSDINKIVTSEISRIIKAYVLKNLSANEEFADWIIKNKKAGSILNYALYNEFVSEAGKAKVRGFAGRALKKSVEKNWQMKFKDPKQLVELAKELGIDLTPWLTSFLERKINLNEDGSVIIDSSLVEAEWKKTVLLDEFKMLYIHLLLEEGFFNKLFTKSRLKKVFAGLLLFGVTKAESDNAIIQAKRIAWAKIITKLKEAHLARMFSSSEKEFIEISIRISRLTAKGKSLGTSKLREGFKLIEARLAELAFNTAAYKIELLRSMQTLEYDKKREKDIHWLKETMGRLKASENRSEFMKHIFGGFSKSSP